MTPTILRLGLISALHQEQAGLFDIASDKHLTDCLVQAATEFIAHGLDTMVPAHDRDIFQLSAPRVYRGLIASGDEFLDSRTRREQLKAAIPKLLAVEMEGAAVAQVCFEFGVPFAVIRTISDSANEKSAHDFMHFIERVASRYAFGIVKRALTSD